MTVNCDYKLTLEVIYEESFGEYKSAKQYLGAVHSGQWEQVDSFRSTRVAGANELELRGDHRWQDPLSQVINDVSANDRRVCQMKSKEST